MALQGKPRKFVDYDEVADLYVVRTTYDDFIRLDLKPILKDAGAMYNKTNREWLAPFFLSNVKGLPAHLKRLGFVFSETANLMTEYFPELEQLNYEQSVSDGSDWDGERLEGRYPLAIDLRPDQWVAVQYMVRNKRMILGDVMGLGKTAMFAIACNYIDQWPAALVCRSKLKDAMRIDINKFLPDAKVWVSYSSQEEVPLDYDFYVFAFEALVGKARVEDVLANGLVAVDYRDFEKKRDKGAMRSFVHVLNPAADALYTMAPPILGVDEAHKIKNLRAQRSQGCRSLADHAEYQFALSGGAIENRTSEFDGLFRWMRHLDTIGGWHHFITYYCGGFQKDVYIKGGKGRTMRVWVKDGWGEQITNARDRARRIDMDERAAMREIIDLRNERLAALNRDMRERGMYVRRTIDVIFKDREEPILNEIWLSLEPGEMRSYQEIELELIDYLDDYDSAEEAYDDNPMTVVGFYSRLWHKISELKVPSVIDMLEDSFPNDKVIVWAFHGIAQTQLWEYLSQDDDNLSLIHTNDLEGTKALFQDNPDKHFMLLASLAADREGHTLTAAWNHIYASLYWTPAWLWQALGRSYYRSNDPHTVMAHYLIVRETIDEDMWFMLNMKSTEISIALDGVIPDDDEINSEIGQRQLYLKLIERLLSRYSY